MEQIYLKINNLNNNNFENNNDVCESKIRESEAEEKNLNSHLKVNLNKKKSFLLENRQKVIMNNYKETHFLNSKFVLDNIYSTDDEIYSQIYSQLINPYQKKLNTIIMLLKSELVIPINNSNDLIKFFNWLSPLNIEHNMSSKDWEIKKIKYGNKQKLLLQNSISKQDIGRSFYSNYIDLIKNKLNLANVNYLYFEFKSKRFNKVKDIIWAFDM